MSRTILAASIFGAVLSTLAAMPALAQSTTFLSYARQFQSNSEDNFCFNTDFQSGSAGVGTACNAAGILSNADASANIGSAFVAADASVTKSGTATASATSHAESIIGDSFRAKTTTGSPFTWAGNTAEFSLSIDGSVSAFSAGFTNNSHLRLIILNPGALDIFATYQRTGTGFSEWQEEIITQFDWGLGANYSFSASQGNLSSFPTNLTAEFTPGGDFDWAVWLVTDVTALSPSLGSGSVDFFHTVHVDYQGPIGAVTQSASGLFPGTIAIAAPVPEPETYAMLLAGLGLLGFMSRRRKQNAA